MWLSNKFVCLSGQPKQCGSGSIIPVHGVRSNGKKGRVASRNSSSRYICLMENKINSTDRLMNYFERCTGLTRNISFVGSSKQWAIAWKLWQIKNISERQVYWWTGGLMDRRTDGQADWWTSVQMDRRIDGQADWWTSELMIRRTKRQVDLMTQTNW